VPHANHQSLPHFPVRLLHLMQYECELFSDNEFKSILPGEIAMRALLVVVAVLLIFALVGWITFSKGPDRASINIESGQIQHDTKKAMESGAELLHKAGDKVHDEASRQPDGPATNPERTPITR
jgi:hypothetical protein